MCTNLQYYIHFMLLKFFHDNEPQKKPHQKEGLLLKLKDVKPKRVDQGCDLYVH